MFGFDTGILVDLVFHLTNDKGSSLGKCSMEVTLEHKDYTLSQLKASAMEQAFVVLETMLAKRGTVDSQETI